MASSSETPKDCEVADGESWQSNKSVTECNRHMLEHRIATDVTFMVSGDSDGENDDSEAQTFSAHKYVLISRSPVFYSMLCGVLAERGQIRVTDVRPEVFRQMLNYIYTDNLDLKPDMVMFILYASKKYMIPGLTKKCTAYLQDLLTASNVCTILDQSLLFDEKELAESCMKLIKHKTNAVFNSDSFMGVSQHVLSKVLDSPMFTIKEVDVFKACVKWADGKCREQNMESTGINRRTVLGDCFKKLRYADIKYSEFATVVGLSEIFTKEEEFGMLRHLGNKVSIPVPTGFCSDSRFLLGPYDIITTDTISEIFLGSTIFEITIVSDSDVNVNALVIGRWRWYKHDKDLSFTTLSSVTHDGVDISRRHISSLDVEKQRWKCANPFTIKAGYSKLQMKYTSVGNAGFVHVLPNTKIDLKDGHIKLQLTSNQQWMPIMGLEYELVYKS